MALIHPGAVRGCSDPGSLCSSYQAGQPAVMMQHTAAWKSAQHACARHAVAEAVRSGSENFGCPPARWTRTCAGAAGGRWGGRSPSSVRGYSARTTAPGGCWGWWTRRTWATAVPTGPLTPARSCLGDHLQRASSHRARSTAPLSKHNAPVSHATVNEQASVCHTLRLVISLDRLVISLDLARVLLHAIAQQHTAAKPSRDLQDLHCIVTEAVCMAR